MTKLNFRGVFAASTLALGALAFAPAATAQTVQGGSSGGVQGRDVSAGTYGSGQYTNNPDGSSSIGVTGGGAAEARNGGTANTESEAKLNDRRAVQRSTAQARDEDERARSRTRTVVRKDGEIRSRSVDVYKEKGGERERNATYSVTQPDGTVTTRNR